ncbi:MAG: methylmalonyl-CoA epimerase [Dehalococcoidales bacterium]|nr:methylmalonyl-CoA epimerase [Dehalococcoidales bacterium]
MITRIDHIGIAVKSIDNALKLYAGALGLEVKDIEVVESQKVRTAIIPVGESKIELLESTGPEGVIARYIEKRGEGLHHLALVVSDIEQALSNLRSKEVPLIDEKPRSGVEETRIAFLHPKAAGVLIELVEPKK